LQANNLVQLFTFEASKSIAKLIDDNINLLDVNQFRVAKAKERLVEKKNKKDTITRAKKTKTKSTKRDLSSFEYVDVAIKVLLDNKRTIDKDNNCDKAKQRKQKRLKANIVVAINTNIQVFNKNIKKIYEDIRNIIIKQKTRRATKRATIIFAMSTIFAIIKTITKKII